MSSTEAIIIFTRNPELGKVKTRLAQGVGKRAALAIYERLIGHTYQVTKESPAVKLVWYSDQISEGDLWQGNAFQKFQQKGDDLGERMLFAFQTAFELGFKKVIIIGSDLFDLEIQHINNAFSILNGKEAVIGPAADGGFYLLGLKKIIPGIFSIKNWGTDTVLADTLKNLKSSHFEKLPVLNDIDFKEDLTKHPELLQLVKNIQNNL